MHKCALVSGGSRGIGRAAAIQLAADHSMHILINYLSNEDAALETARLIREKGGTCETLAFDVSDPISVNAALDAWKDSNQDKTIAVLVNNAGMTRDGLFAWMTEDDWNSVLDTTLKGFFNLTKAVLPMMMREKYGRIISISSLSGQVGVAGQVNYSAAKAGLIGATRSLSKEMARMNITVNAIAPGFIETEMTDSMMGKEIVSQIPARRMGTASEVADLLSFLASEKASYITGEVIGINGGL